MDSLRSNSHLEKKIQPKRTYNGYSRGAQSVMNWRNNLLANQSDVLTSALTYWQGSQKHIRRVQSAISVGTFISTSDDADLENAVRTISTEFVDVPCGFVLWHATTDTMVG